MEEEIYQYFKDNKIVVIRGYGAIETGESLEEDLFYNSGLENACKIMVGVASLGKDPKDFVQKEMIKGW